MFFLVLQHKIRDKQQFLDEFLKFVREFLNYENSFI
jgi:hypothetical protein